MANPDFVTHFYNIDGDLVGERKKNFFKLLKSYPTLNEEDLKSLCPRNHLERLFQIDIFVHYKMTSKLSEVFKEGNEIFISKILKHPSLLLDIIGNISAEVFVNEFLPTTSYATRMKILRKISYVLIEPQMDEIVSALHKRYGFNIAIKFIHTCTPEKIKDFLSHHEVILKARQIKFIFDKNTELFLFYLSYYKTLTGNVYDHSKLFKYVALKNPKLWFKLQEEQTIYSTYLGRRTSKNFLRHNDENLRKNVVNYSNFLKLNVIVRKLHGDFKEVYFELFPKNTYDINTYNFSHRLLQLFPKKRQWDMFAQTYTRVFGNDILENLIYLNSNFIPLFPNTTVMNKWGDVHYNSTKSVSLLEYCDPKKAIPLIKEKINVTSDIRDRKTLIILLLKNCAKNNDMTMLEAVLKYICFRHRNEDNTSSYKILETIKSLFKLETFNEGHWNHINEMITIIKLKIKYNYNNYSNGIIIIISFLEKYIEYLILNDKPFRKELITYIEDVDTYKSNLVMYLENPEIEKRILIEIIKVYRDVIKMDDEKYNQKMINTVISFNGSNSEHNIDLSSFPGFLSYIHSLLDGNFKELPDSSTDLLVNIMEYNFNFPEKPRLIEEDQILKLIRQDDECYFEDIVTKSIIKLNRSTFENKILDIFWAELLEESGFYCPSLRIVVWLLLNEPRTIIPHFDRIWSLNFYYYGDIIYLKHIKLLSHLGFDKKVLDYCYNKLASLDDFLKDVTETSTSPGTTKMEVEDKPQKKIDVYIYKEVIQCLTILATTREFNEIISKRFLPVKEKVDITDEALNQIYSLQCEVAGSLKKMSEPAILLPTVMKFCLGDYLQSALPSLYSICYRSPENLLHTYFETLSKRGVSTRKHSLFLSCELMTYDYALSRLQGFNEKQVSSQKHMFSSTLKYFRKNPSDELLELVAVNLNTIDQNDDETLKSLWDTDVPKKYKTIYVQKCWYFFEKLREKEVFVQSFLQIFLDTITVSDLMSYPTDFCKHIINSYLKESPESDYNLIGIERFACWFLRNPGPEQVANVKFVFDIISSFKTDAVRYFFSQFYDITVDDTENNFIIDADNNYYIELFKQHWVNTFTPVRMFNEHVLFNLLDLKCKSRNIVKNYAVEVVTYLETLIVEYGPNIYFKFKDLVLYRHNFDEMETFLLVYNILTYKKSTVNYMLALDLLRCLRCSDEVTDIRNKIIDILKGSDEPVISIYLNSYFE